MLLLHYYSGKPFTIMTLKNAIAFFESRLTETNNKGEIKVYQEFIQILSSLEKRDFSETNMQSIEAALDSLNLVSTNKNKQRYFKKALRKFEKYLKDTHSLTSKSYYTTLGVALGSSFGVSFGVVILSVFERSLGIALGIGLGMFIGLLIGRSMDSKAAKEGRVL